MFICKICSSEVKQGQAYCSKCGADVVENYETVCPVCGSKNAAGSRYCSHCGGILEVMRKPVCSVCGCKNLPGAKFCVGCGAPIIPEKETHSEKDILEIRNLKFRLDEMERERMAAVDREVAEKLARAEEEKARSMQEVDDYKKQCEDDYKKKVENLEAYRQKLNEFGADDVKQLRRLADSLKKYSEYYADPYSQIDEDDIEGKTYVCPVCGAINPIDGTTCLSCGRNRARSVLLLAKNKIKQSPPIKRKKPVIPAPELPAEVETMPTLEQFEKDIEANKAPEAPKEEVKAEQPDQKPYMHPAYNYPHDGQSGLMYPTFLLGKDGQPYQMPPIVQPVAFVPYVTQEQPLMQYMPAESAKPDVKTAPADVEDTKPVKPSKGKKGAI